jgi:DNA polymerase-3 subunit epsilon
MRQIVLNTETTGVSLENGDRIVEIGCVEIVNRQVTGNNFHTYLNPEYPVSEGAFAAHGLSNAFLIDKPKFREVADSLLRYVSGAEVLMHNASFDLGFIENEFVLLGMPQFTACTAGVTDTLKVARAKHPDQSNSLDALCLRYGVTKEDAGIHGALNDAMLLAKVYIAMSADQVGA